MAMMLAVAWRLRAAEASLTLHRLPTWHDVDRAADVEALQRRLASLRTPVEPPLEILSERLTTLLDVQERPA